MSLLSKDLMEDANFEYELAKKQFIETECSKCYNTEKMKKRKCVLLYGYIRPSCKDMDIFIEKETKEVNKKLFLDGFKKLTNIRWSK